MRFAVISEGRVVNVAEAEPDFAQEQGWVEIPDGFGIGDDFDGAAFTKAPPPPSPVPQVVSRRQAKRALLAAGLLDDAEDAIAAADTATRIDWADALEFRRDHPLVTAIGAALQLDAEAIDDLFRTAATIV